MTITEWKSILKDVQAWNSKSNPVKYKGEVVHLANTMYKWLMYGTARYIRFEDVQERHLPEVQAEFSQDGQPVRHGETPEVEEVGDFTVKQCDGYTVKIHN